MQFVTLWRGDVQVQMSSRSGQFVTLRELREEVGNDAARFYYVSRKSEQHIDFDLDLAKSQSKDNPCITFNMRMRGFAVSLKNWQKNNGHSRLPTVKTPYMHCRLMSNVN